MIFCFLVKMTQADVNKYYYDLYESYSREICHLRIKGTRLLHKIKLHEIKMNQRKQQHLKPHLKSIKLMTGMVKKLVKISAIIETYRYFQITMRPLTNNQSLFDEIANNYYNNMLKDILLKIKCLNESNESVDFTIN